MRVPAGYDWLQKGFNDSQSFAKTFADKKSTVRFMQAKKDSEWARWKLAALINKLERLIALKQWL